MDTGAVKQIAGPTPLAVATFRGAEPSFAFYGDPPAYAHVTPSDVDPATVAAAKVIYAGSIALATPFYEAIKSAWAVPGPIRVLDPNLRPFIMADPTAAVRVSERVEELARTADLVKMSDVDAHLLYGPVPADGGRAAPAGPGCAQRDGDPGRRRGDPAAAGPRAAPTGADSDRDPPHRPGFRPAGEPGPVVDTTGCGDSVTAAMMHRLARGLADDDAEWLEAVIFALRVAAHVAARRGGATAMPYFRELL